jgi:cell wall-associated NlpC family hydrolase
MVAGWAHVDRGRDFARRRVDCWGFVMYLSLAYMQRSLPDLLDEYDGIDDTENAVAAARQQFVVIPRDEAQLGDIVLMHHAELPFHVGLHTGAGHMIQLGRRSHVSHPSIQPGTPNGRRVEGIYRYAGG